MIKKYGNIIILAVSLLLGFFICNLIAEAVFHHKYGSAYNKKSIFGMGLNKLLLVKKDLRKIPPSNEFYLTAREERKALVIDLDWQRLSEGSSGLKISREGKGVRLTRANGQGRAYAELSFTLEKKAFEGVANGEYSLAAGVSCESDSALACRLTMVVNDDKEIESPLQLYKEDLLLAVLPDKKGFLKSDLVRVRLSVNAGSTVFFSSPKLILTPIYHKTPRSNYREPINIEKSSRVRIMAVGGSTTYGVNSEDNCTWPAVLQQRLNYLYPDKFEVLNLGTWGASARDFTESFDKLLLVRYGAINYIEAPYGIEFEPRYYFGYKDLKPDIVLIAPCWNDIPFFLMNLYYDKPFLFGKTYRQVDEYLAKKLCGNPIGFFIYKTANKVIFSSLFMPGYARERKAVNKGLKGSSDKLKGDILKRVEEFKEDKKYLALLKGNYRDTLSVLSDDFNGIRARVGFISLPSMVFTSSDEEASMVQKKLGWSDELFLLYKWGYTTGGGEERDAMRELCSQKGVDFYDLFLEFRDYSFQEKEKIFSDLIHFTELGNNYISELLLRRIVPVLKKEWL